MYIFGFRTIDGRAGDKNQVSNWCQQSMTEWERKQKKVFKQTSTISCIANQRLNEKFRRNENQFKFMHMEKKFSKQF